jgi:ATP adenylyltransferase
MDHLWTPWRMKYIQDERKEKGCPFCRALEEPEGEISLIVYRGKNAFVMLNRYPYTSGHLMVLPLSHQEKLASLEQETRAEMIELINHAGEA